MIIMDEEAIKKEWEDFSDSYSKNAANNMVQVGICMMKIADVDKCMSIVEAGCGDGRISAEIVLRKKKEAKLVCIDLVEPMCKKTVARLQRIAELSSEPFGLLNYETKTELLECSNEDFTGVTEIPIINTSVYQGSNEDLRDIVPDRQTDLYIASLSLHIVPNPTKMISEAFRVLREGGRSLMSVWGQQEGSNFFMTAENVLTREGVLFTKDTNVRDLWHLNDKEKVIDLFTSVGFKNILVWNHWTPMSISNQNMLKGMSGGMLEELLSSDEMLKERIPEFTEKVLAEYQRIVDQDKSPHGFYTLIISAEK